MGKLAEALFGFSGAATRSGDIGKDLERARALGSSLLMFLIVPWTLCLIFYSGAETLHHAHIAMTFHRALAWKYERHRVLAAVRQMQLNT